MVMMLEDLAEWLFVQGARSQEESGAGRGDTLFPVRVAPWQFAAHLATAMRKDQRALHAVTSFSAREASQAGAALASLKSAERA